MGEGGPGKGKWDKGNGKWDKGKADFEKGKGKKEPEHKGTPSHGMVQKHEWIWKAISLGELEFAKTGSATFDFTGVHATLGTPLTAFLEFYVTGKGAFNRNNNEDLKLITELVEWLMNSGADATALTPSTTETMSFSMKEDVIDGVVQEKSGLRLEVSSKPTSSVVLELREQIRALTQKDARWEQTAERTDHLFTVIKRCTLPATGVLRAQVPEVVVDMWERIFQRGLVEGDVEIIPSEGQSVRAYAHVLEEASPVLKAMLQSSMLEGGSSSGSLGTAPPRKIRVEESARAVRTLVEMVHIGALTCEEDVGETGTDEASKALLDVFKLCHRWQLLKIGELLEMHLVCMVTHQNIEAMLEVAVLHGAPSLKSACLEKGKDCESLRQKLLSGGLMPAVEVELRRLFGCGEPETKRRRKAL